MADLRLAVFDCDGTLVDSQHSIVQAMFSALDAHGLEIPEAHHVTRMVGLPLEVAISRLVPDADVKMCAELSETYKSSFYKMRQNGMVDEPLFPGVVQAIEHLKNNGWLLGIATGKAKRGLVATLDKHNILEQFITCQTADLAQGKPHPDMMLRAMAETGVEAQNTIMIGDTTYDMEMAISAKTSAVGVGWGYHEKDELLEAGAIGVADNTDDLITMIFNMDNGEVLSK
ncbi:MAG: HAD-IA family hydrolase [Rhodospirillaceae bacterium]|nr:HAD-IA family hydrolase [Rhodospirillaceae bacterium]